MAARFASFFTIFLAICVHHIESAPIERRQVGSLQCNIARLQTVRGLSATTEAVDQLASTSSDPGIATAQSGLQTAKDGISTIAQALGSGQNAPAEARDQVAQGLTSAKTALEGIQDATLQSGVQGALTQLGKTAQAGQQVAQLCGGGGGQAGQGGEQQQQPETEGTDEADLDPDVDELDAVDDDEEFDRRDTVAKRQIGSIQCNVARLKTVQGLGATTQSVQAIADASANDQATATAASSALTSLASAQDGISQIAQAIVSGQNAPASARDQTGKGLLDAKTQLAGIQSTDPAVTQALSEANTSLDQTIAAGQDVVNLCKANDAGGAAGGAAAGGAGGLGGLGGAGGGLGGILGGAGKGAAGGGAAAGGAGGLGDILGGLGGAGGGLGGILGGAGKGAAGANGGL